MSGDILLKGTRTEVWQHQGPTRNGEAPQGSNCGKSLPLQSLTGSKQAAVLNLMRAEQWEMDHLIVRTVGRGR